MEAVRSLVATETTDEEAATKGTSARTMVVVIDPPSTMRSRVAVSEISSMFLCFSYCFFKRPEPSRPAWDTRKVREHADQIQKRKQLWKAADEQQSESPGKSAEATESAWSSAIAATAGDTVQAEKFARLMGLKKGAAAVIQNADTDKVSSIHSFQ